MQNERPDPNDDPNDRCVTRMTGVQNERPDPNDRLCAQSFVPENLGEHNKHFRHSRGN